MGRTATFATADAARAARDAFWRRGYADTSIADLEAATGLSRSSLYHAFTSKDGLFAAAITSYLDEVIRPRLAPLLADQVDAATLNAYLTGLRAALADPRSPARQGCLLISAATAPAAEDERVRQAILGYRAELRRAVGRGVRAARPDLTQTEADRLADTVTGLVVAALALARVDAAAAAETLENALIAAG
ncbi:TetR/AcrR family transcriptional regulator [Propioniciclava sp.]|uniref:TetR/AcrR family transcriptional regulator n=1 Tax=Propioniciclava sp. TaxID=2038686 RepID=UPI002616CAC5|nr:TetR/AcrR family transcriptional regulator [Propioniciclava sp.]